MTLRAGGLPEPGTGREVKKRTPEGVAHALVPRSVSHAFLHTAYGRRARGYPNPVALDDIRWARVEIIGALRPLLGHAATCRVRSHQAKPGIRAAARRWRPVGSYAESLLRVWFIQPGRCRSDDRPHARSVGFVLAVPQGANESVRDAGSVRPPGVEPRVILHP